MYTLHTFVRLHDTDAAGILFFANQFKLAHDAYESFMDASGNRFSKILNDGEVLYPIVHAEADYNAMLEAGDRLTIRLTPENIGKTSFTLSYKFVDAGENIVGTAQTVHVCVDRRSGEKKDLPEDIRLALNGIA